jgi:hypothetical protein
MDTQIQKDHQLIDYMLQITLNPEIFWTNYSIVGLTRENCKGLYGDGIVIIPNKDINDFKKLREKIKAKGLYDFNIRYLRVNDKGVKL